MEMQNGKNEMSAPLVENTVDSNPLAENENSPAAKKRPSRLLLPFFILLFILFSVGGVFAYINFFGRANYDTILLESVQKVGAAKSHSEKMDISFTFKPELNTKDSSLSVFVGNEEFTVHLIHEADIINENGKFFSGSLTVVFPTGINIPLLGSLTVQPKVLYVKPNNDIVYVRFENLPFIPFFNLEKIQDQWVRLSISELEEKYGLTFNKKQSLDTEQFVQGLLNLYDKHNIFSITNEKGYQYNGQDAYNLSLVLNRDGLRSFFQEALSDLKKREDIYNNEKIAEYQDDLDKLDQDIDELFKKINFSGKAVITKEDGYLRFIQAVVKTPVYDIKKQDSVSDADRIKLGDLTIHTSLTLENINAPIFIEEPKEAITLEEFTMRWSESYQLNIPEASMDENELLLNTINMMDSDGDGIPDIKEDLGDGIQVDSRKD